MTLDLEERQNVKQEALALGVSDSGVLVVEINLIYL